MRTRTSSSFKRVIGAFTSLLMAALFVGLYASLVRATELNVEIDQATLVRLDKPGSEVIIGNPTVADVAVQSGRLLVVTGKSTGLTNLMVLDGAGNLVYDNKVFVSAKGKGIVTVNRGTARATMSCAPSCDPALVPGDAELIFEPLAKAIRNKLGLAQSALDGTTSQQ